MRFLAPLNTTSATISSGLLPVDGGFLTVPDDVDLTEGDRLGLIANGFTPAPDVTPPASSIVIDQPPADPAPAKAARTPKAEG